MHLVRPMWKTYSFSSYSPIISTRMVNCILLSVLICFVYLIVSLSVSMRQPKETINAYFSSSQDQPQRLTEIDHIVFGIGSSLNSWPARRDYVKLWWDTQRMRGCVFVDQPLSALENNTDSHLLPPICVSEDTSRFRYTCEGGDRSAIRIARCVLETVRMFNNSAHEVRWYVFGDDDTIFIPENLARTLSKYDLNNSAQDFCANGGDSSYIPDLSPNEMNEIFLESTTLDTRGHEYGLGSLLPLYGNKKRKGGPGSTASSAFAHLQEQLEAAQRLIEEQAAANARRDVETAAANAQRDAERAAQAAEQQSQINTLKMLVTFMKGKDPTFSEFMTAATSVS